MQRVIHAKTLHLGPEELLVAAKLAVAPTERADDVAAAIDEAERRARDAVPELTLVMYLEPDVDRGDAYVPAERPEPPPGTAAATEPRRHGRCRAAVPPASTTARRPRTARGRAVTGLMVTSRAGVPSDASSIGDHRRLLRPPSERGAGRRGAPYSPARCAVPAPSRGCGMRGHSTTDAARRGVRDQRFVGRPAPCGRVGARRRG